MSKSYTYDPSRAAVSSGEKEYPLYTGECQAHSFVYRILAFHEGEISLQELYTDLLVLEKVK